MLSLTSKAILSRITSPVSAFIVYMIPLAFRFPFLILVVNFLVGDLPGGRLGESDGEVLGMRDGDMEGAIDGEMIGAREGLVDVVG